jgi:hypothetical protein
MSAGSAGASGKPADLATADRRGGYRAATAPPFATAAK